MDTSLKLRMAHDEGRIISDIQIKKLLSESRIVKKLTSDWEENHLFNIFRIICLSEIPYIKKLDYTKKVIEYIKKNLATAQGFSYTGEVAMIVPCYNAMLLESFVRLGLIKSAETQNALNWIKKYQVFQRDATTSWNHEGICKHGGCMKSTPCYIGIGKTIRALITYSKYSYHQDKEVEMLIDQGLAYMLKHNMFQRLSNGLPISAHITDIMFPQAYMLSLTDLVYIANERELWDYEELILLKKLINKKRREKKGLMIDYVYSHKGYKSFGSKNNISEWVNYYFSEIGHIF